MLVIDTAMPEFQTCSFGIVKSFVLIMLLTLSHGAFARSDESVTCTGKLIEFQTRTTGWPLAVIYDADVRRTCTIDRAEAEQDPMKPCSAGERCRVSGTYRRVGNTYSIRTIISVDRAD
jgi:hypothetical protein